MKLLFDLFPVALFFAAFKVAEISPDAAAALATHWFGALASGGEIGAKEAPVMWATIATIVGTLMQVIWLLLRRKRIEPMLWISLGIVVVFGGATLWFHDDTFIKWKPTVLYWASGIGLAVAQFGFGNNFIRKMMGAEIELPESVWLRLLMAWIGFFVAMGCINLFVAFNFPTETWVNFKMFGSMGLMLAFVVGQAVWLGRHLPREEN
ncbi:septation protein A [Derxia gummosa]|uniref:Inner membrane-spanning protein YciB n=1 Tax=Derxia gummosa DSM 723 TaxID=1121388 RepID=A0A8B6X3M6_9BURK|nr:septation protein A [Derxia gummosa]